MTKGSSSNVPRPSSSGSSRGEQITGGSSSKTRDSVESSRKSSEESTNVTSNQPATKFGRFNMFARRTTKKKSKDLSIKETKLKLFLKRTSEPLLDSFNSFNQKKASNYVTTIFYLLYNYYALCLIPIPISLFLGKNWLE